jgi:hypothetical protein
MRSNSSQGNLTVPERGIPPQKRNKIKRANLESQQDFLHYPINYGMKIERVSLRFDAVRFLILKRFTDRFILYPGLWE